MYCLNFSLTNILGEEWKDVINYDGYYQISNFGRIKSLPRQVITGKGFDCFSKEKIKKVRLSNEKTGRTNVYCEYSLNSENKRYNLSKQVALHFMENYNNETLYFIDGDRNNCALYNLLIVNESNVIQLYNKNVIVPPNEVSELLHKMGLKKCSICKEIKDLSKFSKANRNRDVNNNCQKCVNSIVYDFRNKE